MKYRNLEIIMAILTVAHFNSMRLNAQGDYWIKTNFNRETNVLCFAVDKNRTLFVGTNNEGIYYTEDAGVTWTHSNNGLNDTIVNCLYLDSRGGLFAATHHGVFRSYDGGKSWVGAGLGDHIIRSLTVNAIGEIIAGGDFFLFRSADSGRTWLPSDKGLIKTCVHSLFTASNGIIYAGSRNIWPHTNGGIYRSIDHGHSWSKSSNGLLNEYVNCITVTPDSSILVGVGQYFDDRTKGVYRSIDDGQHWYQAYESFGNLALPFCFAVDSSQRILLDDCGTYIHISDDDGITWEGIDSIELMGEVSCMIVDPGGFIYVGTSRGIYRSSSSTLP